MTLPKKFFSLQPHQKEALLVPALIVATILIVLLFGLFIGQQIQKRKVDLRSKEFDYLTKVTIVKDSEGKTIGVPARVNQISAELLYTSLKNDPQIKIVQVFSKEEWKEPHIKGTIFMPKKSFEAPGVPLNNQDKHIFVSGDGFDSAVALNKLFDYGFPRDKNLNLEGGLNNWKKKGYPVEN